MRCGVSAGVGGWAAKWEVGLSARYHFLTDFVDGKLKKKKSPKSYRQNVSLRRCRVMNVDTAVFNKLSYI